MDTPLPLTKAVKGWRQYLLAATLALLGSAAYGQSTANYTFASSTTGSLVDMSSGTTDALATGTYRDDVASSVAPIGFTFTFMGTPYTDFSVNSNGQLRLGTTVISGTQVTPTAGVAALAPLGGDNAIQAAGKVHYKLLPGTNRVLVVEWNSLRIPFSSTAATGSVVQALLEENTGKVEYRYGAVYNNSTGISRSIFLATGVNAGQIGVVKTFTTTPTYDATVTSATTTSLPDNAVVPGLNSTADGARTVYTFTPPTGTPAAPGLAASSVLQTTLTLNITDNSTNEGYFTVSRSTDNTTFTTVGTVASTAVAGTGGTLTLPQTGLTAGTTYYYRVVANNESGGVSTATNLTVTTAAAVPICGTKTVGPGANYASLTAAFADITNNGLCGPLVLELQASYVSTAETFPLTYSYAGASATNTVTVRPAAGATGLAITNTAAGAVFNISGGKYLIIDGRPGGSGTTVSGAATSTDLLISSTSTSGIPLQFTSDATFNTVQHCQIKGVGTSDFQYPDVNFTGTVTTSGNSDNVVQYNNIGDGASTPVTLVYCGNSLNARNTLTGNNLLNFYSSSSASYGIELNQAGAGWIISNNSLYQTATRNSVAYTHYGIYINSGNGHTISGNYIGGSAASAGGTAWTVGGTAAAYRFVGIYLSTSGAATSVQGNTVANFSWLSTSGATTSYGVWSGIYVSSGSADIGTVTGNVIGTSAGGVTVSSSTAGSNSFGISSASTSTINIAKNVISNLTATSATATTAQNIVGIYVAGSTANSITQNKIYGLTAATTGVSNGIWASAGTTNVIANNLIGDLRAPASTSLVAVSGIQLSGGTTHNVYYNTIGLAATSTGATFGTSGIYLNSTSAALDARNNIVVNKSTAVGTGGYTAALRRISGTAGTAPANLATTSNNNLYYAGTPSATNLLYIEGTTTATNALQTLADYKSLMTPRETSAVTEDVPFASTTGSAATFLHINPATPTLAESGAQVISSITTDFDGDTRSTTRPDIGADEGAFTPGAAAIDLAINGLVAPATTGCYGTAETVTVSIRNAGSQPLNFATSPATVTVVVTTPGGSQTLTTTVNTGTLALGATQNVSVGTLNMSAAGTYSFAASVSVTGDGDATNNSLTATRTVIGSVALPQAVDFTGFTGSNLTTVFPNWYEATGATLPAGTTSAWSNATGVGSASNVTAKVNLYTNTRNEWIVGPKIAATATTRLSFRGALTDFASTTSPAGAGDGFTGTDDAVRVMVSADCGLSFTEVFRVDASNQPSPTAIAFSNYSVSLAAYAGQNIIVAFKATDGPLDDTPDYDFHLDDVVLENAAATDVLPTALLAPVGGQGCYGTAEAVTVTIRNNGTQALDLTANPVTVTVNVTGGATQTLTATVNTGTLAVGATQNVSVGTLNMSAAGTYTFAVTATATGDGNTSNDQLTPSPTVTVTAPVAGTVTPAASTICISGTATLTLTGSANGSIQWQQSADNVTFTDISGATSATYTTAVLTSTTYFRARTSCNAASATSNVATVTVNNPQITNTNSPQSICTGSTATITASASSGSSVRFFDVATGGTALATTTPGSYTTPALTANATYYAEAYTGGTAVAGLADNSASNGTFTQSTATDYPLGFAVTESGTLTSVDVYPTAAGTLTIRLYRVAGTQPAGTATAVAGSDVTVTVTAAQVGTRLTVPLNYVLAAGEYKLSNFAGGLGRYSTYSGSYPLTSTNGVLTVKGSYTFYSSTSYSNTTYNSFFNLTFSNECASASRTAIQVNVAQPATATLPATASSCGTAPVALTGTVGGSATGGTYTTSGTGTFAPNANTLNATYTPSAADLSAGTVTLTLTTTGGPCTAATAAQTLTLTTPAVATFSYPASGSNCAGTVGTIVATLGTGATAGTFSSTTGLSLNAQTGAIDLATSTAGTYTVTNTVAASGACAAVTATATITINPMASAAFSYAATSYCTSGTTPTPTVTGTSGGTFSSTTGLSLNATTGAINLAASTPGTYTVTYTAGTACPASATATVTITAPAVATFSYPASGSNCAGTVGTIVATLGTGATAGTFSSTTGLSLNAQTGAIDLATSTAGTYTVTNTVAASGACAAVTATATITLNPTPAQPTVTVAYGAPGVATLTSSAATGNQWYLGPNPISGATAQTYVANGSTNPGAYTVRVTSAAGCTSVASAPLTVTASTRPLAGSSLTLFPNPTPDGQLTLELRGYRKAVELTLLNAVGQVVQRHQLPAGQAQLQLDLTKLPAGVYVLRATSDGSTDMRRIVRE